MKKIVLLLLTLCFFSWANAQEYKKIKVGLYGGYVIPAGGNGGGSLSLQPGFRITDQLAVNLRGEVTFYTRDIDTDLPVDIGVGGIGSVTANVQYYFFNAPIRPFVSFGLGYYIPAEIELTAKADFVDGPSQGTKSTISPDPAFGIYPGIGVDLGHWNVLVEYHIVGDSEASISVEETTDINGNTTTTKIEEKTTFENSYLSLKLGYTFGGGR